MKNLFFILLLCLTLNSCNESDDDDDSSRCSNTQETCLFNVSNIIPAEDGGLPNEAFTFDTNLSLVNFSSSQQDKIYQAAALVRQVVATEEFREAIMNFTYDGQKAFVDNGGLTNAQIYQRFLEGAEKLSPSRNNAMDVQIELYYEDSRTIGYTKPDSKKIWMNTKYFNNYSAAQVAGNLTHEWVHKLGFGHDSTYTESRSSSVPYALGYLMERLARTHL